MIIARLIAKNLHTFDFQKIETKKMIVQSEVNIFNGTVLKILFQAANGLIF